MTLPPEVERLIVFDLGPRENLNNVVSVSGLTSTPMPEGQPVPLALQVRTGDAPLEGTLHVHVDGVPRVRHVLPRIDANTRSLQELVLPPLDRGIHRIEVVLEPQDPLLIDNRRYAHVLIDRRPRVLLLHGERPGDLPTMVEAMLAPPGLDPIHTRFEVQRAESTALGRVELRELLAVLLVDVPELDDSVSRALAAYARAGGLVLIIPGDQVNPADYERCADLLGLRVAGIDDLEPGIRTAVDDFTHPYLRPFGEAGVDSLNDREAFRRLRIEALAAGARPVIRFGDGAPALVENRLGSGTVLTLAFSPAREWGQYGTQAAPTIVLLNTILESHIPRSDRVARYEAGQIASANLAADARVRMPDGSTAPLRFAGPRATLPTDSAGLYAVLDKSGNEIVLSYAVNLSDEESDLAPIERAEFLKRFPAGLVTVVSQVSDLQTLASASAGATSLWVPFALAVLVLLMLESAFSNRFYGFGPPAPDSGLDDAN